MTIQPWETNPDSVAYEFITAMGMNHPDQVTDIIKDNTAASLTREASENWNLYVSLDQLEIAISKFIRERPDKDSM